MSDIDAQVHRDLGELTATVRAQGERLAAMETRQLASDKKLNDVHDTIMQAAGGWRVLVVVGGIGVAIGGLLVKFIPEWIK